MNSSSRRTNVMFLLMGALSVGLVFLVLAIAGVFEKEDPVQPVSQAAPTTTAAAPSAAPSSVSDIYRRVSPGVVFVSASGVRTEQAPLDVPPGEENQPQASGSGFLIDRDGYIVTNDHVVDGADKVTVRFGEEGEPIDARVVGTDPSSDIALLKVDPGKIEGGPKSERGPLLERLQAMSTDLEAAPERASEDDPRRAVTYVLNPAARMSSGKTVAQVAHAAVLAADGAQVEEWVTEGCPGRVLAPPAEVFAAVAARADLVARVVDAGLTEVPRGTVTVVALPPAPSTALPEPLSPAPSRR